MEDLLADFINDCMALGYSHRTIESYSGHIRYFIRYNGIHPDIDINELRSFLIHLRDEQRYSSLTINAYFAALSVLFTFLVDSRYLHNNDIPMFRKRYLRNYKKYHVSEQKQLIVVEQLKELIESIDILEHQTLMIFLAKTGIRRNELITLDRNDISLSNNSVLLKPTPKRSNRLIYFDDECKIFLEHYLLTRSDNNKALFLSSTGRRITRNQVYDIVTGYARKLGLHDDCGHTGDKFTPHCFRVWFTTHLRRAGMSRSFIQELRGDSRSEAMDVYDRLS